MTSLTAKMKATSAITPRQRFQGHTGVVNGIVHLPDGQRIITCSLDGSLRAWNLKSGKQIGEDWRDGESSMRSIALSPEGKKVVSGSLDGAIRLWDIDTCKAITKWTGHTKAVVSLDWSGDGRRVLSGSLDGTGRQWDVETGETISMFTPAIVTPVQFMIAVYSPDTTLIAGGAHRFGVQIWDVKIGEPVANLQGHTRPVSCLAWTKNGKILVSGSFDKSIRTWNTTKWEQIAVLDAHTSWVWGIAISPDDRILASASNDETARLWHLESGQPIGSPLQHAADQPVPCVSFSADGKLLATGCGDENAYTWDVAAIVKEAGLDDLLSYSKTSKLPLHADATRPPVQRRPPADRVPHGFFDGVPPAHSSAPQEATLLRRLFHRGPSSAQDTSPSSPLDWARNLFKRRGQSGEEIELQGRNSTILEVPYAKGKRRNASAREVALAKQKQKTKPLPSKNSTAGSSQPPKPNVAKPSLQPQSSSSTTPTAGDATAAATSTPSRPDATIRQAGLWTRFWLFLGCLSPEYTDDHH